MSRPFVLDIFSPSTGHSHHEITTERATVGRASTCAIRLDSLAVELEHARFVRHGDDLLIEDLDSRAGVKINGLRVARRKVAPADEIEIANFILRLVAGAPDRVEAEPARLEAAPRPLLNSEASPFAQSPGIDARPRAMMTRAGLDKLQGILDTPDASSPGGARPEPEAPGVRAASRQEPGASTSAIASSAAADVAWRALLARLRVPRGAASDPDASPIAARACGMRA